MKSTNGLFDSYSFEIGAILLCKAARLAGEFTLS